MRTVEEIVRVIEQLPRGDFEKLATWMIRRRGLFDSGNSAPQEGGGTSKPFPGSDQSPKGQQFLRDHTAFLNSYSPADEGLYDDVSAG